MNNTCYQNGTAAPLGLDGTISGSKCVVDFSDDNNVQYVGNTTHNVYYTNGANDVLFPCHDNEDADDDHEFTLAEMQGAGFEIDTKVKDLVDITPDDIIEKARLLLW